MRWVVNATLRPLPPSPGMTMYSLYMRLGGPQNRSGRKGKILPPLGFDPRTVQPVATRCIDYAIPTHRSRSLNGHTQTRTHARAYTHTHTAWRSLDHTSFPFTERRVQLTREQVRINAKLLVHLQLNF
jgi:hypothetical protein